MTFINALAFSLGLSLRLTWSIILPVIGIAAILGVPLVFPF